MSLTTLPTLPTMPEDSVQMPHNTRLPFPAEFRNQIYRHVFTIPKNKLRCCGPFASDYWEITNLALLRVSKATHQEAISLLYSERTFRIGITLGTYNSALLRPSVAKFGLIRDLTLDISGGRNEDYKAAHTGLSALNSCFKNANWEGLSVVRCNIYLVRGDYGPRARAASIEFLERLKGLRRIAVEVTTWEHARCARVTQTTKQMINTETTKDPRDYLGEPVKNEPFQLIFDFHGFLSPATRFTFHPLENTSSIVEGWSARLVAVVAELLIGLGRWWFDLGDHSVSNRGTRKG